MIPKLVFINLLIDSLWSDESFLEKVFDVKSPGTQKLSRVNERLGRYFAENGDYIVCADASAAQLDSLQADYLELKSVQWIPVNAELSMVDNFVIEVENQIRQNPPDTILIAGVSRLELSLVEKLNLAPLSSGGNLLLLKRLNSKDYLLELATKLQINIPKSELVSGAQITESNHLYKSLVSSGGSGVYVYEDLERIRLWSQRRKLLSEWNSSTWLKQETLDREVDINCFGTTESNDFKMVCVKYDKTRLSYQHDFNFPIESVAANELELTFNKIRNHLIEKKYVGPFGFDSILTKSGDVFPIVDLNVRMNKSHVLSQIVSRFKNQRKYTSFFRLRFINNEWPEFTEFWNFFANQIQIEKLPQTDIFPIDASFWNEGKSECLLAIAADDRSSITVVEKWVSSFLISHKGQGRD